MMKTISNKDERWKKFPFEQFNAVKYTAHKELSDSVRNRIDQAKAEIVKAKKQQTLALEAEAKRAQ